MCHKSPRRFTALGTSQTTDQDLELAGRRSDLMVCSCDLVLLEGAGAGGSSTGGRSRGGFTWSSQGELTRAVAIARQCRLNTNDPGEVSKGYESSGVFLWFPRQGHAISARVIGIGKRLLA